jgi:hypothetical protein
MSIRKSSRRTHADQELLDDCDYLAAGGWRSAVGELVYQLRVLRGHWFNDADDLDRLLQASKSLPLAEENNTLTRVQDVLASIQNHPKADLAPREQQILKEALREAIKRVRQRRPAIFRERQKDQAIRKMTARFTERPGLFPSDPHRVNVDLARMTITLDGKEYDVSSENALRWVNVLADHPLEWISSSELERHDPQLGNPRTDRYKKHLPKRILSLIDSETGKGSRIRAVSRP